jgi:hypothetical protein
MSTAVQARHVVLRPGGVSVVIQVSEMVPEGKVFRFGKEVTGGAPEMLVGPLTYFSMTHDGRYPLESFCTNAQRELELERKHKVEHESHQTQRKGQDSGG